MKLVTRWWSHREFTLLQKFSFLSFLCIFAVTVAVSASVAEFFSRQLVRHDAEVIADLTRIIVTRSLPASLFTQFPPPEPSLFETAVAEIADTANIFRVILYNARGTILWSDDPSLIGRSFPHNRELQEALRGTIRDHIVRPGKEEHQGALRSFGRLEEVYIPLRYEKDGPIVGALEIYRHPPGLFAALDRGLAVVWILGGGGGLLLYLGLLGIVRRSSRTQETLRKDLAAYTSTLEERVAERTEELAHRTAALATLYAVSSTINQSLYIQTILDRALQQVLEIKGYCAAWIHVRADVHGGCPTLASRGVSPEFAKFLSEERSPGGKGGQVMQTGEPLILYVDPDGPPGETGWLQREGVRAIAFLPIPLHDRPIGTLNVARRSQYRFTTEDARLLSSVAQQIGIAIGNARLYEAARQREEEARILYETTRKLGYQTELDTLLTVIIEGAVKITHASFGGVGFPEGDDIATRRLFPGTEALTIHHKISHSVLGYTYTSGHPQIVDDVARDPRINHEMAQAVGLKNGIFAPLRVAGEIIGVVYACNNETGAFTEHDLVLLTTFANHAAAAIENSRLHAETLKREREASILYRTCTRLPGQTDREALLTTIVEGAIEITNATCGMIGERIGEEIVARSFVAFPLTPGETEIRLPLTDNAVALTYGTGEPVIINDLNRSSCAPPIRAMMAARGVRNFICVPLKSKNAVLGVIKVCNKTGDALFTGDDLRLLTTFATQAAMILDNVRLFHESRTIREHLEHLIGSSVDAIVTVDPRGLLTFVSQGGEQMFGYGREEVAGASVLSYWVNGRKEFRPFRKLLAHKGRVQNYETELFAANRKILSVNISASLLHNAAGRVTGALAVIKDVTNLRKLHEQMIRSERLAATGLLAAGVAHEVGNPLACVSSLAQVLLVRTSDPPIRQGLADILNHAGRIQKIVCDLTHLARPAPFKFRESALGEIVQNAVALARHNPAARKMTVVTVFDPSLPAVRVVPDQLLQVFLNLILNSGEAGGDLTIEVALHGNQARAVFTDTGRGMSADELRRIFDPFYSTKDNESHLGLGLFVSHEIVRQHGGILQAESEPGRGATFTLTLPVER